MILFIRYAQQDLRTPSFILSRVGLRAVHTESEVLDLFATTWTFNDISFDARDHIEQDEVGSLLTPPKLVKGNKKL